MEASAPTQAQLVDLEQKLNVSRKALLREVSELLAKATEVESAHAVIRGKLEKAKNQAAGIEPVPVPVARGRRAAPPPPGVNTLEYDSYGFAPDVVGAANIPAGVVVGSSTSPVVTAANSALSEAQAAHIVNAPDSDANPTKPLSSSQFAAALVEAFNSAKQDALFDPTTPNEPTSFVQLAMNAVNYVISGVAGARHRARPANPVAATPKAPAAIPATPIAPPPKPAPTTTVTNAATNSGIQQMQQDQARRRGSVSFMSNEDPTHFRRPSFAAGALAQQTIANTTANTAAAAAAAEEPKRATDEPAPRRPSIIGFMGTEGRNPPPRRPSIFMQALEEDTPKTTQLPAAEAALLAQKKAMLLAASDRGRRSSFFDDGAMRRASIVALGTDSAQARRMSIIAFTNGVDDPNQRRQSYIDPSLGTTNPKLMEVPGGNETLAYNNNPTLKFAMPSKAYDPNAATPANVAPNVIAAWGAAEVGVPQPSSIVGSIAVSTFPASHKRTAEALGHFSPGNSDDEGEGTPIQPSKKISV